MCDRLPRKFDVQTSHKLSNYVLGLIFVMNIKFPRATYRTIVPSLARIRLKKKLSKDGSQQQSQLIFGTEAEI